MNITEETNDYFSTTEKLRVEKTRNRIFSSSKNNTIKGKLIKKDCSSKLHDVIIVDLKEGDIMDEDEDGVYRNYKGRYIIGFDQCTNKDKSDFAVYMERQLTGSWNDQQVWNNLKDKLKTTPDSGIKRITKVFRVDWSKVFKRGWLLWK